MTSTVLDVTVLLLCVSASVITLGAVGGGQSVGETEYAADDAADRLATETTTIASPVSDTDGDDRTVHATLVELLSMATAAETWNDTTTADRFRTRAVETVDDALGPRTRVEVRHQIVDVETIEHSNTRPTTTRSGTDVGIVRGGSDDGMSTSVSTREYQAVTVGPEPPRDASVTVAVVTHPGLERLKSDQGRNDRLRAVIRVW